MVPDGVPFEKAAVAADDLYGTTIHGLKDRGHIKAGDTVLILGAAGGVGLSAVELAKAFGARVVAAVSSEAKGEVARKAGADDVVIYPREAMDKDASKALAAAFKTACGPDGANIVYDIVGGQYFRTRVARHLHGKAGFSWSASPPGSPRCRSISHC